MKFIRQLLKNKKTIDPCERSVFQLLEQFVMGKKGPRSYRTSTKAHANLFKKCFLPMHLEDLAFCIKRAGWKVTKIHAHLTFEQSRFKQHFILMNQKSRQLSKNSVEKDFYKLMNNSNFGYDCRNNLDDCKFPTDEIKKIYQKYKVNQCYLDQNLTDTDSTSIFFVFICDLKCNVREDEARNIIFEVILKSKVFHRLDLPAEFYDKFNCRNESLKKRV